jgi:hypothetical protein
MEKFISMILFTLFYTLDLKSQDEFFIDNSQDTFIFDFETERKYSDSICQAETKRAFIDISENRLTFSHEFGLFEDLLYTVLHFCTVPYELQNCYSKLMKTEIDRRFGNNFIDSLSSIAQVQYENKMREHVYAFEECDTISRSPNDKYFSDFFSTIKRTF